MPTRRELLIGLLAAVSAARGLVPASAGRAAPAADSAELAPEGRLVCTDPAVGAQDIASPAGLAAGGEPLWALGWMPPLPPGGPLAGGQRATLLWVVDAGYAGPVQAVVTAVADGRPLQLRSRGGQTASRIGLQAPGPAFAPAHDPRFLQSASSLLVPAAGCYTLVAESAAGRWQVTFAAGG